MVRNVIPAPPTPRRAETAFWTTGTIAIVIGGLYIGRDILIPLALSILLSFVLTPPMLWLRRHGIPRIPSTAIVVLVAFTAIAGVALAVGSQLIQLAQNLPTYQRNVQQKIAGLRASAPGAGLVERVTNSLKDLRTEMTRAEPTGTASSRPAEIQTRREPVPVVIEPPPMQPLELLQTVLGPLVGPLGTAAIVLLFVIFILLEREDLRDRFIKLVGGGDLQRSTEAISDAASRVSSYLGMQLVVNASFGFPIGMGLWLIGVPNAVLWGVLASVLRFIPYLGTWIAALFPLIIAFGVDPGWSMLLWTIALFLVVELTINNAVEPWLYGVSTGLSSLAIIVATIFWSLLWGPVGLFLATPLTVCLVVIGRYVPNLEFLGDALGSEPVLTPPERFYQRLLSGNVEEAVELAEKCVDETTSQAFYDDVAIPALRLAESDRRRSEYVEFRRSIADTMTTVVREIVDHTGAPQTKRRAEKESTPQVDHTSPRVLCIGGRNELDLAAAEIIAGRLAEVGISARTVAPISVSASGMSQLDLTGIEVVCLSYLQANPAVYARYACRRLLARGPNLQTIVCCWNMSKAVSRPDDIQAGLNQNVNVATSLAATELAIISALSSLRSSTVSTSIDGECADRLRRSGYVTGKGPEFERLTARICDHIGPSVVLIAVADEKCLLGVPSADLAIPTETLSQLLCNEVVKAGDAVFVEDVAADKRFAAHGPLLEKGIRFFAAIPLRTTAGGVLGALCVFGSEQRSIGDVERVWLATVADEIVAHTSENEVLDAGTAHEHVGSAPLAPVHPLVETTLARG